jgi:hypothetical protein
MTQELINVKNFLPANSDIKSSVKLETKVTKADLVNIVHVNVLAIINTEYEKTVKRKHQLEQAINKAKETLQATIKEKLIKKYTNSAVNTAFHSLGETSSLTFGIQQAQKKDKMFNISTTTTQQLTLIFDVRKHPSIASLFDDIEETNTALGRLGFVKEKISKDYIKAQLDINILAGTTEGKTTVEAINELGTIISKKLLEELSYS